MTREKAISALASLRGLTVAAVGMLSAVATIAHPVSRTSPTARPPIRHVFLIVLENESFDRTFGPQSPAPYLARDLVSHGTLLQNYYGIGHSSLDNYIAMISGQAPNQATQLDCTRYTEFQLSQPKLDAHGQAIGTGCVYPAVVKTVANQFHGARLSWKGYMEDMGDDPSKESADCGHPAIGSDDRTTKREKHDQYATKHNPFFYFHAIIDNPTECAAHVVNLRALTNDLASAATTPNYVFITPNLCNDGHDSPCVDSAPGGLVQADGFLRRWVPVIRGSPAFASDGLLIIAFDEAGGSPGQDSSACCGEQGLPGQEHPPGWDGPGGGRVGAVLLSPFIRPGTVSSEPYNHYSMLRSIEDFFGLPHLGYAGDQQLKTFGADIFGKQ